MQYKILAIRDRAADVFGQPIFTSSVGGAIRAFSDEINTPREGNNYNRHPEDFDLYHLGSFDDESAEFTLFKKPEQVAVGKDLKINP
nr:MAG: nonstructural protein [Microviridae sp.]